MSNTTVPLQITANGVDTFTAGTFTLLRTYTAAITGGERAAVDILMTRDIVAETIADLAYTLRDNAAYGALAEAVAAFFDAEAVRLVSALTWDDLPGESATIIADLEMNLYRVGRNIDNQVLDYDLTDLNTDLAALAALIAVAQEQISKAVAS